MSEPVPGVTLLITHYNRSRSLERLLRAFRQLGCTFEDTVVSDDGSQPEHLARLRELACEYPFRLLTTPVNRGLGHNLNKGQDAIRTPYTLYVQEDFQPTEKFPAKYRDAVRIMEERPDIDLVRFWAFVKYPYLEPYKYGFSEMVFKLTRPGAAKFFSYSDTPHLRRKSFFEKFGRYAEGISAIKGEKAMVMSFLQSGGKGLETDANDIFLHENSATEPSTQDYRRFFALKKKIPAPLFDLMWSTKLTAEYLFRFYRH